MITHSDDPRIGQSVRRICSVRTDTSARQRHECSARFCSPVSEADLIGRGELTGPAIATNVFVCRFGFVHVCSEDLCTLYPCDVTHTCAVSGIQYAMGVSAYQSNDYKTWNAPQQSLAPMRTQPSTLLVSVNKTLKEEHVKDRAGDMVRLLLYSTCRVQYNKEYIQAAQTQATESCVTYEKEQIRARQLPLLTDRMRLLNHCTTAPLPLCIFVFDQQLFDYYVAVITQTWFKVQKWYVAFTKPSNSRGSARLDVEKISLGVLYTMRSGHIYQRVVALPRDEFLLYNLPQFHMLHHFGIEKSDVTCGMHIVEATFERARLTNVAVTDISIDAASLPVVSVSSPASIIGTNGERLFMLSSRANPK